MSSVVMPIYARSDLAFERGEGAYLITADGRRFLDFVAGVAVNALGHGHPALLEALTRQAEKLWHCSNLYQVSGQEKVASRLVANSFADTVFFCNSGAEALEGCIKIARKYQYETGHPERYRIIAAHNAFHGRTLATLAAGGQEKHLKGFGPVVEGFDHVSFGNMNELRAALTPQTAAILVEPVQGEGGLVPAPEGYLRALRDTADEYGLLLLFDEVQCGMGRTGKLFAHQWTDVVPDVMGLAKGLGGGFPVGAVLATEKAAVGMTPGSHGCTFGGNPLAMAVADAVLDVMLTDGFMEHVVSISALFRSKLDGLVQKYPDVFEGVRGAGLMLGLVCRGDGTHLDLYKRLQQANLLCAVAGSNVLRFVPPLVIDESHVNEAIGILDRVLQEKMKKNA